MKDRIVQYFVHVVHRDVKMQNILLKDNYQQIVLTDYGTATNLSRVWLTRYVGTPGMSFSFLRKVPRTISKFLFVVTMAPEIIRGNVYDEQCDIYSWAIIFWQLIAKRFQPYDIDTMTKYGKFSSESK